MRLYHVDVHVAFGGAVFHVPDVSLVCLLGPVQNGEVCLFKELWGCKHGMLLVVTAAGNDAHRSSIYPKLKSDGWFCVTDPGAVKD